MSAHDNEAKKTLLGGTLRPEAAAIVSKAEEAAKRADQARLAALTASSEVAQATMPLRRMRHLKLREQERVADAERSIASADSIEAKEAADAAKANSKAKIAELEAQFVPAEAELQPKINALAAARKAVVAAEAARAFAGVRCCFLGGDPRHGLCQVRFFLHESELQSTLSDCQV